VVVRTTNLRSSVGQERIPLDDHETLGCYRYYAAEGGRPLDGGVSSEKRCKKKSDGMKKNTGSKAVLPGASRPIGASSLFY